MTPKAKRQNNHDEAQAEGELHAGSEQDNGKASQHEDSHNTNAGKRRGSRFDGNLGETPGMEGKPNVRIDVKNDCGAVLRSCLIGLDDLLQPSSMRFFRSTSCVEYVPVMAYTGFAHESFCASDSAAHFGNTSVLEEGVHCIVSNQQSPPDQQIPFKRVVIMQDDRYNCPDRWSDLIVGDNGILESLQEGYGGDGFVLGLTFWGHGQAYMDHPTLQHVQHSDMGILRALMVSGFFNPLSPKWGIGQNVILVDKGPSMAVTHAFRAIRRIEQCLLVCGVCINMPVDCIPACGHVVCRGCASQVSQCPWCQEEVFWCAEGEDGMWKVTDIDTWLTLTRGALWAVKHAGHHYACCLEDLQEPEGKCNVCGLCITACRRIYPTSFGACNPLEDSIITHCH